MGNTFSTQPISDSLYGLGLDSGASPGDNIGNVPVLGSKLVNGGGSASFSSGLISFGVIPKGTKNLQIHLYDVGENDSLELFTTAGKHVIGTTLNQSDWIRAGVTTGTVNTTLMTAANGFDIGASYDGSGLNGSGGDAIFTPGIAGNNLSYNGMNISYSGNGNPSYASNAVNRHEYLTIDEVTEDLLLLVPGAGVFQINASWGFMPPAAGGGGGGGGGGGTASAASISTQTRAQSIVVTIDGAIITKDKIRANLGAMQNRLENTASNLRIQAENLLTAESRISDANVAAEMMEFVRSQTMASTATAVLTQANNLPKMILRLLE